MSAQPSKAPPAEPDTILATKRTKGSEKMAKNRISDFL
jgi:hypothetical protein